jgi:subtilisin-like proprotein convertase family protein
MLFYDQKETNLGLLRHIFKIVTTFPLLIRFSVLNLIFYNMTKPNLRLWLTLFISILLINFLEGKPANGLPLKNSSHSHGLCQQACNAPYGLNTSYIGTNSVDLIWTHEFPNTIIYYDLEIRPLGQTLTGVPTHTGISRADTALTGLISGQVYRCKVRAYCGSEYSTWSSLVFTFRTLFSNPSRCGASYTIVDNLCPAPNDQSFPILIQNQGDSLGRDVRFKAVRLIIDHNWRSDLQVNLISPDGTNIRILEGLNAGDVNIGNPTEAGCAAFLELTNEAGALPLGAMYQIPNPTGRFLPRNSIVPFNNLQNPNGTWRLVICDRTGGNVGSLKWVELVFERANCTAPIGVSVSNTTKNTADVTWQKDQLLCDSFFLEWGSRNFSPGLGNQVGGGAGILKLPCSATLPQTLIGLTPFTFYDVYVRRACGTSLYSDNSIVERFFTDCTPNLEEKFDNQPTCSSNCNAPCSVTGLWQNITIGDNFDWKIWNGAAPSTPNTGPYEESDANNGNYLYFETTCVPNSKDSTAVLRSKCIKVIAPTAQDCHFAYDYFMWNTSSSTALGKLTIEISTDGGLTWTVLKQYNGSQGKGWKHERINLNAYHNSIATFRLVATGSVSQNCDIALDNLRFYGSTDNGAPDFTYYRDFDGDGFGDINKTFTSCSPTQPPGYKSIAGDCNDQNANIYPTASEIICNNIDENCNGQTDDGFIAKPSANNIAVCNGNTLTLQANGTAKGNFYWYDAPQNGNLLHVGTTYSIPNFQTTKTIYLKDSIALGGCSSSSFAVQATAYLTPDLSLMLSPAICQGESFDLTSLAVFDNAGANGLLSYHTATPANSSNRLLNTMAMPNATTNYYVLSTTNEGCKDEIIVTLKVNQRPIATIINGDSTSICKNGTKKLVANAISGTSPFTYAWNNGLNFKTIDITGNTMGNVTDIYKVTVTDSLGCQSTDFIKIRTLNSVTQTSINTVQQVSTCGGNDGSITLTPQNGNFPMQFSWSGAASGSISGVNGMTTISGLKQGNYRITVSSNPAEGCFMVMPLIVLNAPGLQVNLDTIQNPACFGLNTGSIKLQVQGTAPVYQWSNNQSSRDLNNIAAGSYSVTITDGACQQILDNLAVLSVDSIKILANNIKKVSCFGGNDGALDIAIFGGNGAYQTTWNNNAPTEDITALATGWYECLVTDALGCTNTKRFYINQPTALGVNLVQNNDIKCYGDSDAAIMAMPSGGTGIYQFNWNNGANTQNLNALVPNNYSLTLTDENGCTKTSTKTITQPTLLVFDSIQITNPVCVGSNDGKIKVFAAGGTGAYSYLWNNGITSSLQNGLMPQIYSITLTDANGCTKKSDNIALNTQQLLNLQLDSISHVRCYGETNGSIAISVLGSQGALQYHWNEFPNDDYLENLFADVFRVVVKDTRGCTIVDTFEVRQPNAPLGTQIVAIQNPICFGEFGGGIEVQTDGGTLPYMFQWSNGATTQNINELSSDTYQLTVTDNNGCTTKIDPQTITQPSPLKTTPLIQDIPCNGSVGSIVLQVQGGITPYNYQWSTSETTQNIYQLSEGNYATTVKDANGCRFTIDSLSIVNTNLNFLIATDFTKNISCFGTADAIIGIKLLGGIAPFRYAWSHQTPTQNAILHPTERDTILQLSPGSYRVIAIDAGGCVTPELTLQVAETPILQWQPADLTMNECKYAAKGAIQTNVSGGFPPYGFDWDIVADTPNPDSLRAGFYRATVTDINGCLLSSPTIEITEPLFGIEIQADSLWQDDCFACQGAIYLHSEGGVLPYIYQWDDGSSEQDLTGLCAGVYTLTVTDVEGCTNIATYTITSTGNPLQLDVTIQDVACKGEEGGSIVANPFGGVPDYELTWSNGDQGEMVQNLAAGDYTATLTDMAGCVKYFSFLVQEPDSVLLFDYTTDSTQAGWNIHLDLTGGTSPYQVKWYNAQYQPIAQPTGLASGIYHAAVTDFSGCRLEINGIVVGTVSTNNIGSFIQKINLAPNPTSDEILLCVAAIEPFALTYQVVDALGRVVLKRDFIEKKMTWQESLSLGDFGAGVYWMRVFDGEMIVKVVRLVKY